MTPMAAKKSTSSTARVPLSILDNPGGGSCPSDLNGTWEIGENQGESQEKEGAVQ